MALRLAQSVTIYTNGSEEGFKAISDAQGSNHLFEVDNRRIVRMQNSDGGGILLTFDDQTVQHLGFLAHKPKAILNGTLHKDLDIDVTPFGTLVHDPMFFETPRKGVFVVGDAASPMQVITQALFSGSAAAAGLCAQLQLEDAGL